MVPGVTAAQAAAAALGAPLTDTAPLLAVTADRLKGIVTAHGGEVLTGHEAVAVQRTPDGRWPTTVKDAAGTPRALVWRNGGGATGGG